MSSNKNKMGCFTYSALGIIVLGLWFLDGFLESGFELNGGLDSIGTEFLGWLIVIVVAIVGYFVYEIIKNR